MPFDRNRIIHWSEGTGRNLAKTNNKAASYAALARKLFNPYVTPETRAAFEKMSKDEQDQLKSIAGWISGAQFSGKWRNLANLQDRDLATIDIDYAKPGLPSQIKMGLLKISRWAFIAHSSRRHTEDSPRIRIFIPLSRKVDGDEYQAIIRYLGWLLDKEMKLVDMVSYRPAQMMFLPTCSKDDKQHYFFHDNAMSDPSAELLDVDATLAEVSAQFGDYQDMTCLPRSPDEADYRTRVQRAENPLEKQGIVGDFCRAYPDIEVAMEKFLPGVYIPGDQHSGNPRYTYAGSTSSNGAVIYDHMFLYSHHGHDPVCNMNVNAFDLIRIHLFGGQDVGKVDSDTPVTKVPSFKAMAALVEKDEGYLAKRLESKFSGVERFTDVEEADDAEEPRTEEEEDPEASRVHADDSLDAFADIEPEPSGHDGGLGSRDRTPPRRDARQSAEDDIAAVIADLVGGAGRSDSDVPKLKKAPKRAFPKPRKDWFSTQIEVSRNGEIVPSLPNIKKIIQWDSRLWGKIGFNRFTQRLTVIGDIDPKMEGVLKIKCSDPVNGMPWEDWMTTTIICILEGENGSGEAAAGYGMKVGLGDVRMALDAASRAFHYHPIVEWLESLEWDKIPRVDTFLQRYIGEVDTPYVRETARLLLVGACYRAITPGLKFDHIPIIEGTQGTRKSTFVTTLASKPWFGELHVDLSDDKKVAEQIAGMWFGELPEMVSANKTEVNALKQFARRVNDTCRMAYMKEPTPLPRQAVFVGTTNDAKILRDPTGNRTFLMLKVAVEQIDTVALAAEREQLFAEAMVYYRQMRAVTPEGDLPLEYVSKEAKAEATARQTAARNLTVGERLAEAIIDWADTPVTLQKLYSDMDIPLTLDFDHGEDLVIRHVFREKDMKKAVIGSGNFSTNIPTDGTIQNTLEKLPGWRKVEAKHTRFKSSSSMGARGTWYHRETEFGHTWSDDARLGYSVWVDPEDEEEDDVSGLI